MSADTFTLEILRYVPDRHPRPEPQIFRVPYVEGWSLLDALGHVQDEIDASLAYRWSCRMGVCGSCGMMVDGEPRLACEIFLRDHHPGPLRVEPLAHFPIERDLVVCQDDFLAKLTRVRPWLHQEAPPPRGDGRAGEQRQRPAELLAYEATSQCINCLLCYSACPQVGLNEGFLGPAAIALAHRYDQDSRDQGAAHRREALQAREGVWTCTLVGHCSTVCPKGVDPAGAIQKEKLAGALTWARDLLWPRGGEP